MIAAKSAAVLVAAGAALAAPGAAVPATASVPSHAHVLFHLRDPRIDEASGIAVGVRSPGVMYVQNDSGDRNRFFAVDARTGATAATVIVHGARNADWEDIAAAPDAAGTPSVWLADIGDNDAVRSEVRIYRVAEPHVDAGWSNRTIVVPVAQEWRLRYPGGATDAESLAVTPDGAAYVATKSLTGTSTVYRVPGRPDRGSVQELQRIGSVGFVPHGTANPFGVAGELTATGAAMSKDGAIFAIRTYAAAYLWRVDGDLAAALRHPPTRTALPRQRQGEGIAIDGRRLVLDSEGRHSAVLAVALPSLATSTATSATDPSTQAAPSATSGATTSQSGAPSPSRNHSSRGVSIAAAVVLVLLIAVSLAFRQRRRRRPPEAEDER